LSNEQNSASQKAEDRWSLLPGDPLPAPNPSAKGEKKQVAKKDDSLKPRARLGLTREVVNSIGMKFVMLPAGRFVMGSAPGEAGRGHD
jgi:hypothetical protein